MPTEGSSYYDPKRAKEKAAYCKKLEAMGCSHSKIQKCLYRKFK